MQPSGICVRGWLKVVNKLKNYTDIYKEQILIFGSSE